MQFAGDFIVDLIWDGIVGSLGFGFLGYCLALTLLFFMRAKKVLKRTKWYSKFFVVTYWIFIPIICACGFTATKAISYAKSATTKTAFAAIDVFEEKTYPSFNKYITENIEKLSGETIIPTNEELTERFFSTDNSSGGNWITKRVVVWFLDIAEDQAETKIADQTNLSKEEIHSLRLFKTGEINTVFHGAFNKLKTTTQAWINSFFMPYFTITGVIWMLLLIFPVVETIVSLRRRKSAKRSESEHIADL